MNGLRRRGWWLLVAMSVLLVLFGIGDVLIGPPFDPGIALGLTGLSHQELQAESAAGYRLLDFYTRIGGVTLTALGVALSLILLIPYRAGERWAWRAAWLFPAWTVGAFALNAAFGVAPGEAPPPPMISGPILGAIAAVVLVLDAPRFRAGATDQAPDAAAVRAGASG